MIVLTLVRHWSTKAARGLSEQTVAPTVVVDEEDPAIVLARSTQSFYVKCFALPGKDPGSTIHRRLSMSSDGVFEVIDTIRCPGASRGTAIYREATP